MAINESLRAARLIHEWGVIVTVTSHTFNRLGRGCDRRDRMNSRKATSRGQPQASRLRSAPNAISSASATTKRDSLAAELERGPSLL